MPSIMATSRANNQVRNPTIIIACLTPHSL